MAFEKTMMGNPSGANPEKPFNPRERIGFGIKYPSAVETPKMTPEEQATRAKLTQEADAQFMESMRAKIGINEPGPARTPRKNDVVIGMKAPTPEEIAAYGAAQEETKKMEEKIKKGGILSRIGKFFGGN